MRVPIASLCLLIGYLSSYRKNQNQNFTGFVSLDLVHFLGHSPISKCLIYPISIKPLSATDPSWGLCSCCGYYHQDHIPLLLSHIWSGTRSLIIFPSHSLSHFYYFFLALWLISQFRILLAPGWPPCLWSLLPSIQLFIFVKLSLGHRVL